MHGENKIIVTDKTIESEDTSDDEETIDSGPSHADASSAIETAMKWHEKQPEFCLPS